MRLWSYGQGKGPSVSNRVSTMAVAVHSPTGHGNYWPGQARGAESSGASIEDALRCEAR